MEFIPKLGRGHPRPQPAAAVEDGPTPVRELLIAWVHLAVLWSFAVAKPLFDVLADAPDFFVARGNTRGDILVFAFALILIPPTLGIAIELLLVRFARPRRLVHLIFVGILVAAIGLQILDDALGGSSAVLIPLAIALGAAVSVAYARGPAIPSMLTILGPAPAVFLVLFLLFSPVSKLVLPQSEAKARAGGIAGDTPVVMMVLDEFRLPTIMDGHHRIDARRFPNFAALARSFTWYRNATTVADQTTRAVPAILTGRVPATDELPIVSDHPRNLFTMLAGSYSMNVRESATALCPDSICKRTSPPVGRRLRSLGKDLTVVSLHRLLPSDLEKHLPAVDQTFGNFGGSGLGAGVSVVADVGINRSDRPQDSQRGAAVETFLRSLRPEPRKPRLDFLHIFLPHIPWMYLPSGRLYPDNGIGLPGQDREVKGWGKDGWVNDSWLTEQAFQRFTLQLEYVDRLVGRLIARLRSSGLYDRALVVVVADHGVSFHPGGNRRAVTSDNLGDIAGVPLFVKLPHQTHGRVDDSPVRTVDVLPTIADVLNVRQSWDFDGRSLLDRKPRGSGTVSVAPVQGRPLSLSFDDFLRARDEELRRTLALFGSDRDGVYRIGPDAELVGKPLSALTVGGSTAARVVLDGAQQFAALNPRADVLPAFVTGRLEGVKPRQPLAIAVNGRVRAVGIAVSLNGETRVATMVPENALRRGANSIRVLEIRHEAGELTLVPLRQAATETFRLARRGGGEVLIGSSGSVAHVVAEKGAGYLEILDLDRGGLRASGWSAARSRGAADRVVAFVNGRFVAEAEPSTDRPDIAKIYGPDATRSGFLLNAQVPADEASSSASDVRVFGVFGGAAVEIPHPSG